MRITRTGMTAALFASALAALCAPARAPTGVAPERILLGERASVMPRTAAILAMNMPGVDDMREAARDVFARQGVKVVSDEIFEVNVPDHTPYILQMKALNLDVMLFSDSAAGAAKMFLSMKRQSRHPPFGFGVAPSASRHLPTRW